MAADNTSGEKTEKATPKRLRDARKRGEVAKSRDLTNTLGLAFIAVILYQLVTYSATRLAALTQEILSLPPAPFSELLAVYGRQSTELLLLISALVFIPVVMVGLLVDYLQTGPVLTLEKIKPKLSHLSLTGGLKRMFGMDNLVELIKSIAKTAILILIALLTVRALMPQLMYLPTAEPANLVRALWEVTRHIAGWTLGVFLLLTALDVAYQQHAFGKRMRMSVRDIRQEFKDTEGDPLFKSQRRQTAQEWAENGAQRAAADASVLVVNPTHVAIAIRYDRDSAPVPEVTAKGQDDLARAMRDEAERWHVPIVRNVALARALLADCEAGDVVPRALFDSVAEVILWAGQVRERVAYEKERALGEWPGSLPDTPGEDLTHYPRSGH